MTASITKAAYVSFDEVYRYWLSRIWNNSVPFATFIMLNPSKADAEVDDATVKKCMAYARAWGCGGVKVGNLYAFRATDPKVMRKAADPVGPRNDTCLATLAWEAWAWNAPIVGGWGANADADPARVAEVLSLPHMDRLTALSVTKSGQPGHPLYLPADLTPQPWGAAA